MSLDYIAVLILGHIAQRNADPLLLQMFGIRTWWERSTNLKLNMQGVIKGENVFISVLCGFENDPIAKINR